MSFTSTIPANIAKYSLPFVAKRASDAGQLVEKSAVLVEAVDVAQAAEAAPAIGAALSAADYAAARDVVSYSARQLFEQARAAEKVYLSAQVKPFDYAARVVVVPAELLPILLLLVLLTLINTVTSIAKTSD